MAFVRLGRRLHTLSFLRPGHLSDPLPPPPPNTLSLSHCAAPKRNLHFILSLSSRLHALRRSILFFFVYVILRCLRPRSDARYRFLYKILCLGLAWYLIHFFSLFSLDLIVFAVPLTSGIPSFASRGRETKVSGHVVERCLSFCVDRVLINSLLCYQSSCRVSHN